PLSRGFERPSRPGHSLASYQIDRQLSGWILLPLVFHALVAHGEGWGEGGNEARTFPLAICRAARPPHPDPLPPSRGEGAGGTAARAKIPAGGEGERASQPTATSTSEALTTAVAAIPLASFSSSTASLVMEAVTMLPPISMRTCDVVAPLTTSTTVPLSLLRALIFMVVPPFCTFSPVDPAAAPGR